MDKDRLFPHLILWICRHLSTAASKNHGFSCCSGMFDVLRTLRSLFGNQVWQLSLSDHGCCSCANAGIEVIPARRFGSGARCRRWLFLGMLFACFLKISPDFRFFYRFTIDLYIKIVVIVNADFSVDKSLFFNRINRLRAK